MKKPYNPILGEFFRTRWNQEDGTTTHYVAEQTSHHPPISSLYISNRKAGFMINGSIFPRSKFFRFSVASFLDGTAILTLLDSGEVYTITFPTVYGRGMTSHLYLPVFTRSKHPIHSYYYNHNTHTDYYSRHITIYHHTTLTTTRYITMHTSNYVISSLILSQSSHLSHFLGIIVGTLLMELCGNVTISCQQTQCKAEIEFKEKVNKSSTTFPLLLLAFMESVVGLTTLKGVLHWRVQCRYRKD